MKRSDILTKALETVTQRQQVHGKPENTFGAIAGMWSVYLSELIGQEVELKDHQAAMMVGLLKVARSIKSPEHADNFVDLAGYAACAGELAGESALQQLTDMSQDLQDYRTDEAWPVEQHGFPTNIVQEIEAIYWGKIPSEARWVAKDESGYIFWYTHKPNQKTICGAGVWFMADRDIIQRHANVGIVCSDIAKISGDWKKSLRKRPK